jgi:hypothetical protein
MTLMAWAQAKTAVVVGVGILLASGTAIVAVKAIRTPDPLAEKVWDLYSQAMADDRPGIAVIQVMTDHQPMAAIRLSQLKKPAASGGMGSRRGRPMGIESKQGCLSMGVKLRAVLSYAYGGVPISGHGPGFPHNRIIVPADLADASYDFVDTMPRGGGREVLRRALKDQFGLVARREMHDNLVLTVKNPAAAGLHKHTDGANMTMVELANKLGEMLGVEVMDQTGLAGSFDFHLNLPRPSTADGIKRAILDQLGLGLSPRPDKQKVEFLVAEKVR